MDNRFTDNKICYYLKPTDSPASKFYHHPKIHQPGVATQFVSCSSSLLCNLSTYLATILKAYVKDENNKVKDSTMFSDYIRNVPYEDDKIMVSYDVTSFHTNIPIIDTLETVII